MALLRTTTAPFISNPTAYWLSNFAAVLACLDDHALLENRPVSLDLPIGGWSLADFRGRSPVHAFAIIERQLRNWAFQYLLVEVLNDTSLPYLQLLLAELSSLREPSIDLTGGNAWVAISGSDSMSGRDFATRHDAKLFCDLRRTTRTSGALVADTDLVVIVENVRDYRLAVFGEVEGNHGEQIRRDSFWARKSPLLSFGVGVVPGAEGKVHIGTLPTASGDRVVLLFERERGLAADFMDAVGWLGFLIQHGPADRRRHRVEPGLKEALDYIAGHFQTPVSAILHGLDCQWIRRLESSVPILAQRSAAPQTVHVPSLIITPHF